MEQKNYSFDLFDVIRVILKWKTKILMLGAAAGVIAAIYFMLQKNYYNAYGSFFPASSVISGRVNLFSQEKQEWIDYFGTENEVDRIYVLGNSASVISYLIGKFNMAAHYQIDTNAKDAQKKVYKRFTKNFTITRSGYNHIEINFTDESSDLAYQVVNEAINRIESQLRLLYGTINRQLAISIENRADSIQQNLVMYSDSLARTRVRYQIYDLIGPSRQAMASSPKGNGLQFAQGLEEIQNLEEVKNRLATDRARYLSLANEFRTSTFDGFPMIHVMQWASPNGPKAGPFRILGVLTAIGAALIFGIMLALGMEVYSINKSRFL